MALGLLRRIHRWVGLLIALPVALLGVTGTILALEDMVPEQRTIAAPAKPVNEIVAAAERWGGPGSHATRYFVPEATGHAARVEVAVTGGSSSMIRVDPATLAILDAGPANGGVMGLIRQLHVRLAIETGGRGINGWFGIGLLFILVTSVPIWWPRSGHARRAFIPDFRIRRWLFHRRLHGAAGVWIVAVLAVLTSTGIAMAFPATTRGLLGLEQRAAPRPRITDQRIFPTIDVDRALVLARQAMPELVPRMVILPTGPAAAARVMLTRPGERGAVSTIQVQIDMAKGTIASVDAPATRPFADIFYRWLHDIHTGAGFSAGWGVVASVAGLSLPLLALTGAMMWWRKRDTSRRTTQGRRSLADPAEHTNT